MLGFIEPCLPSPAKAPPRGPDWIHEIKHDGFRLMARRDGAGVRLLTRKGNDFSAIPRESERALLRPDRGQNAIQKIECEEDVGQLGEDELKRWCTLNRLCAVKSSPDRMGWDYLVEFEPDVDSAVPLDQQNDLKKVLIQVKATDAPSRSVRGKLSTFKLLIDADLPAFIAQIDYAGQPTPCRARLLHVGYAQIEAILRKVRQTEKAGRVDLHNVRMTLQLDEAVEIEAGGGNLRKLIVDAVPPSSADYVAAKAAFRKTCGYDLASVSGNLEPTAMAHGAAQSSQPMCTRSDAANP